MKRATYGEKSFFVDDETAVRLMEYVAALAADGTTDTVSVWAVGAHGNEVEVTFLLTPSTVIMTESANATMHPPSNDGVITYMRDRAELLRHPRPARPAGEGPAPGHFEHRF